MTSIRTLQSSDQPQLRSYLSAHADTAVLMLGNLERAGIEDRGQLYQGTYVGLFADNRLVGALALYWNGNVLVQSERSIDAMLDLAIDYSGRTVGGVLGPLTQVEACLAALRNRVGLPRSASRQVLMGVRVDDMAEPSRADDGAVQCRPATEDDLPTVGEWRAAYLAESGVARGGPAVVARAKTEVRDQIDDGALWLACVDGEPVAMAMLMAQTEGRGLVGGVWTQPEFRGRGYGRTAVAGMLRQRAGSGLERALLFTARNNQAALGAYRSLGFGEIGAYGMAFYDRPGAAAGS